MKKLLCTVCCFAAANLFFSLVSTASADVIFQANGEITSVATGAVVGTHTTIASDSSIDLFDTPVGLMFQANGNTFDDAGQTVSLTIDSLVAGYSIAGPITVGTTALVSGNPNPNGQGGFAVGNTNSDIAYTFNVDGSIVTSNFIDGGTGALTAVEFSTLAGNDLTADGFLAAGDTVAFQGGTVNEFLSDSVVFTPSTDIGVGDTLAVTVGDLGVGIPAGEALTFNVNIVGTAAVPEPSSFAVIGLSGIGLMLRRKRA